MNDKDISSKNVYLFGDTDHANPSVKKEIASRLGSLREQRYTTLAVEVDSEKQALVDDLLHNPPADDQMFTAYVRDVLKLHNFEGMTSLLREASRQGMRVACIDEKSSGEVLSAAYPEFRSRRDAFDILFHTGGDAAEQEELRVFRGNDPGGFDRYMEAYGKWKEIRSEADCGMAERLASLVDQGERVVAVLGQSHLARLRGVPFYLVERGIVADREDVYVDRRAYDAFYARGMDGEELKTVPAHAYFIKEKETVNLPAPPFHFIVKVEDHAHVHERSQPMAGANL